MSNAKADDATVAINNPDQNIFLRFFRSKFRILWTIFDSPLPQVKYLLVVVVSLITACAYVEKPDTAESGSITIEAIRKANASPLKIQRIFQSKRMMLDSLPVGSILPYYNEANLRLPDNWRFANGDTVEDPLSPLHGKKLPNLLDERFLMGSIMSLGGSGGTNKIAPDGEHGHVASSERAGTHNHTGRTGLEYDNGRVLELREDGEIRVRLVDQAHRHTLSNDGGHTHGVSVEPAGVHDHGGDARPNWYGVLYIIKIK